MLMLAHAEYCTLMPLLCKPFIPLETPKLLPLTHLYVVSWSWQLTAPLQNNFKQVAGGQQLLVSDGTLYRSQGSFACLAPEWAAGSSTQVLCRRLNGSRDRCSNEPTVAPAVCSWRSIQLWFPVKAFRKKDVDKVFNKNSLKRPISICDDTYFLWTLNSKTLSLNFVVSHFTTPLLSHEWKNYWQCAGFLFLWNKIR